jgi:hypothetical protein
MLNFKHILGTKSNKMHHFWWKCHEMSKMSCPSGSDSGCVFAFIKPGGAARARFGQALSAWHAIGIKGLGGWNVTTLNITEKGRVRLHDENENYHDHS